MSVDRPAASPAISDSGFSQSSRTTKRMSAGGFMSSSGGNPHTAELGDFEDIDLGVHDPGDGDKPALKRNQTDLAGLGIRKPRSPYDVPDSTKGWRKTSPKRGSFGTAGGLTVGSPTKSSEGGGSRPTSRRGQSMSPAFGENAVVAGFRKVSRHRPTSSEIERAYDSDDSIPPETMFHNVPVSPSNVPISEGMSNLLPPSIDAESRRPSTGGSDSPITPPSIFAANPDPFSTSESGTNHRRVVSFHEAMDALDDESKRLTQQLGKANLQPSVPVRQPGRKHSEDVLSPSSSKPLPELPKSSKRAYSHAHLPSTSTLWDPLPVSKEKEAVLSQTRPSWLPPKKKSEEKRHLAEYQRMVQQAEEAELRRQQKALREREEREQLYEDTSKVWQNYIIPNWDKAIQDSRTRALWWNGIPSARRGMIWQKCFGNALMIREDTYRKAIARVADADYAISQSFQDDDVDAVATLFSRIERDCASVFPDIKIFQPGSPLYDDLVNVTKAYSFYRSGFAYIAGSHAVAATLLVNLDPFNAFVALANALNCPLALVFLSGEEMAKYKYYTQFDDLFMTNLEELHAYFTLTLQLHPSAYLDRFFKSFFALYMPLDVLARVWDIFVFEGDKILLCTAVAVLSHFEMQLYDEQEVVLRTLTTGPWDLGKVDVFIKRIADIREK